VVCVHKSHHSKLSWGQSIAEINILVMVMGGRLTWFFLNDGHGHGGRLTSLWTQSLGSLGSKAALAVWHLDSMTVGQTRSVVVHPRSTRGTGPPAKL